MKINRIGQIVLSVITLGHAPALWTGRIYQGSLKKGCVPILNCWGCPLSMFSCPIGGLQHFFNLHLFPFYIAGFFGAVGIAIGRMACGWACPFGLLQDLLHKTKSYKLKLPPWFGYIKYAVLVGVAGILAWIFMEPWFCKMCPAGILEAGLPLVLIDKTGDIKALVGWLFWTKVAILVLVVMFSISIKRFFCRALCPIGAIYSVFNRLSFFRLKVIKEKCIDCETCVTVCPMDVPVYRSPNHKDCIRCLNCINNCPTKSIKYGIK